MYNYIESSSRSGSSPDQSRVWKLFWPHRKLSGPDPWGSGRTPLRIVVSKGLALFTQSQVWYELENISSQPTCTCKYRNWINSGSNVMSVRKEKRKSAVTTSENRGCHIKLAYDYDNSLFFVLHACCEGSLPVRSKILLSLAANTFRLPFPWTQKSYLHWHSWDSIEQWLFRLPQ